MAAPEAAGYRGDLWVVSGLPSGEPEQNLIQWRQAAGMLEGLEDMAQAQPNEAFFVAISDAKARAFEEVRRHKAEVEMRREWATRHGADS